MQTGTVQWWNGSKGFGFIAPDTGEPDIFVSSLNLNPACGGKSLAQYQKVQFDISKGPKGIQAINVYPE